MLWLDQELHHSDGVMRHLIWFVCGVPIGYFLAWLWSKRKRRPPPQPKPEPLAVQSAGMHCVCCHETRRNDANTGFVCNCGWSAEDIITKRDWETDWTCTTHKRRRP